MNEFAKHFEANRGLYGKMFENGYITKDDIKAAGNLGGKYSYEDFRNIVLKRLRGQRLRRLLSQLLKPR